MALLDVSELLTDPDFIAPDGTVFLVQATETVDQHGRTQKAEKTIPITASVQPASGLELQFLPDEANVLSAIEVYTQCILTPATADDAADEIVWQDQRYIVQRVEDYRSYGRGHVVALCTLKPFVAT